MAPEILLRTIPLQVIFIFRDERPLTGNSVAAVFPMVYGLDRMDDGTQQEAAGRIGQGNLEIGRPGYGIQQYPQS